MRFVVRAIEVLAVPAGWHEYLHTDTILALVDIGEAEVISLGVRWIVANGARVVYGYQNFR